MVNVPTCTFVLIMVLFNNVLPKMSEWISYFSPISPLRVFSCTQQMRNRVKVKSVLFKYLAKSKISC